MINAGFNPLQIISEKTGKSIAQLKEEMSKGAISAQMVQQAFLDATAAGGKFYNMSENASKTINGQISMLQDAMDSVFNEIGTKTEGVIIKSIQTVTKLIQNYETIGKVLVGLVTTYGAYRTAILLSTAATSKHTIAEIALTNVRIAARKAQLALNAAMLTNPYVAAAAAIAGLASAMWVLYDNTSKAERQQKAYDEAKANAAQKEKEHADAIQGLIDKVRDNTQADAERVLALDALKNEYPNIFAQYDIEKLKLADILDIKKQINEEDTRRQNYDLKSEIMEIDKKVAELREAKKYAGQSAAAIQSQIDDLLYQRDNKANELQQSNVAGFTSSLSNKSLEELKAYLKQIESGAFKLNGEALTSTTRDSLKKAVQDAIDDINEANKKFYSEDYNTAKKAWEEAKAKFEEVKKDKDKYTTAEYNERKATLEQREKEFKALGGDTTGKADKSEAQAYNERLAQQEKLDQAERKSAKERERTAKDNEFMVEQARISAMKEGAEKVRAQQTLDNKKELENLERQKQDYIEKAVEAEKAIFDAQEEQKAKNDKTYKKKTFDSEASRAGVDTKAYDDAITYTRAKQIAQEDSFVKNLYGQYKSYEDKKKDLEKSYLDDILALNSEYLMTGDEKYVRSINERNKAYVQALNNLESEYGTEEYKLIFGDPSKMTGDTIDKALEAARKKMSQLNKDSDPEAFQALSEAIDKLEDARDNNPFQGWDTSVMGLIQKLYQIRNIRKDIAKYEKEGNAEAAEAAKGQLEKSKKDLNRALIGTGVAQFGDALSTAAASMKEVAKASGDIHLEQQAEALEKAGGFISSVASGAATGGWIGAIVGGATSLMNMLVSTITESKVVAAEAKKAYEDYLEEILRSKRQIKDEDYETIFGVRALEKVIDASRLAADALSDYQEAMDASVGDPSRKDYTKGLANMLTSIPAERGGGMASMREAFKDIFTYEKNGRTTEVSGLNLEEAKKVLDIYKDTESAQSGWYKALEEAVNALEDYEKNIKVVDDYLSSLFQSLGSDIADAIMQGEDALEVLQQSAGDIFASIAKQMITELMISQDFVDKYKEKWRAAMATEDFVDDAAVVEEMTGEIEQSISDAQALWEQIQQEAEKRGIDIGLGTENQQQPTSRGYQTLSEDTGNELAGRALAQYESYLRMEEAMRLTKESVDLMAGNQVQIRDIAAESRALIADSYLELQQIRENTGAIIKPIKNLSDKIDNWDSKIMSL